MGREGGRGPSRGTPESDSPGAGLQEEKSPEMDCNSLVKPLQAWEGESIVHHSTVDSSRRPRY